MQRGRGLSVENGKLNQQLLCREEGQGGAQSLSRQVHLPAPAGQPPAPPEPREEGDCVQRALSPGSSILTSLGNHFLLSHFVGFMGAGPAPSHRIQRRACHLGVAGQLIPGPSSRWLVQRQVYERCRDLCWSPG